MNTKSKGKAPSRFSKAQLHFALFNLWQIYFVEKWGRDHRVFCLPCVIHFSFRNASTLSWKNIVNGNFQNIRDLRGFLTAACIKTIDTCQICIQCVRHNLGTNILTTKTWKTKNEASVGYAITIRSKLLRRRQSSSISSHRYLSF